MKIAIYAGSFDPITNGHIEIIKKAKNIFDKIIVVAAINPNKKYRLSKEDRLSLMKESLKSFDNVEVDFTEGLTVNFAKSHNASYLLRGIRNPNDINYELSLANENKKLDNKIETVFFISDDKYVYVSSSAIIEKFKKGEDISSLVPKCVIEKLKQAL